MLDKNTLLASKIKKYSEKYYPLHMPGHKGGRLAFVENLHKIDVTETAFTDDLYYSESVIADSLLLIREFYKTSATYFLTNGSTVGVLAAMSIHEQGDEIALLRGCHKSVYNAIDLFGLKANYIEESTCASIAIGFSFAEVERVFNENNIKSFVLTSPTYEGVIYDLEKLSELCKKYDVNLIVDEAHGAHIPFINREMSAINYADIVVQSMHKTLPSITGSGLLHINRADLVEPVFKGLKIFQTSSPSYIMMCEMDAVINALKEENTYTFELVQNMNSLKKALAELKNISLLNKSYLKEGARSIDICKLTLIASGAGFSQLEPLLLERGFVLEMACEDYIVAIFTIADKAWVFEKFLKSIKEIDELIEAKKYFQTKQSNEKKLAEATLEVRSNEILEIPLDESFKRVCAERLVPYPPGIPIILEGEVFDENIIKTLKAHLVSGKAVYGMKEGKVKVYGY